MKGDTLLETKEFLLEIVSMNGVSGFEQPVQDAVEKHCSHLVDETRRDALGNLIMLKKGCGQDRPRVMLAAHVDEIGLMVTRVDERGFINFTAVGGVDQRTLPGQEVVIHGMADVLGVIGQKPPHLMSPKEREKTVPMHELYIDTGLSAERLKGRVNPGDPITLRRKPTEMQGLITGKAMDDRAGTAVLFETLKELRRMKHWVDVYAVSTTQEEVSLGGAITSTYGIMPDLGIAVDVTHGDMQGVPEHKTYALDKGPVITQGGNIHPAIYQALLKVAQDRSLPYQTEVAPGPTGTDAWAMQISRAGVPTGLVSIPLRYMHTSVETLALKDVINAGRLLAYFVASIDTDFMEGLKWS